MPTPLLLEQFKKLLTESPSFKIMAPEKQAELMQNFESATDEQLALAVAAIEKNNLEVAENEKARAAQEEQVVAAAQALKAGIAQVKKEELQEDEAKDEAFSQKAADEILASIGQTDVVAKPVKTKKFLGIF